MHLTERPRVVCLLGSTRFRAAYEAAFRAEEHAGRICLTAPCYKDDPCCKTAEEQGRLDALHRHKIGLADEVLVIDGLRDHCPACGQWYSGFPRDTVCPCAHVTLEQRPYVGDSTRREIAYAESLGKPVRFLSKESPCP